MLQLMPANALQPLKMCLFVSLKFVNVNNALNCHHIHRIIYIYGYRLLDGEILEFESNQN